MSGNSLRRARRWAACSVALCAVGLIGVELVTRIQLSRAREAWRALGMPLEELPEALRSADGAQGARGVEQRAAALGLDLTTLRERDRRKRERSSLPDAVQRDLRRAHADWGPGGEPPPGLASWCAAHDREIRALTEEVLRGAGPSWPVPSDLGFNEIDLDLQQHAWTQRVLFAHAFEAARRGDDSAAIADLDAAWRLCEALRARPEYLAVLAALDLARERTGVIRSVDLAAAGWSTALFAETEPRALLQSRAFEDWRLLADVGLLRAPPLTPRPWWRRGPVRRVSAARHSLLSAQLARRLLERPACGPGSLLSGWEPGLEERLEPRGPVHEQTEHHAPLLWTRLGALHAEVDLTRMVLALREVRNREGRWPPSLPALEGATCRGTSWRYSLSESGGFVLDHEVVVVREPGRVVLRHEEPFSRPRP